MGNVSQTNKQIARAVAGAFGGKPRITRYWDDDDKSFVDVLVSEDRPDEGVCSYSTLGLSDHKLMLNENEYEVRVEFVGACETRFEAFANIISTAAFCVINSQWFCYPGAIFPDVVGMYKASKTLQHIFFAAPVLWEDQLQTMAFPDKKVAWLLVVPISEQERQLAEADGPEALEDALVAAHIDIFDLDRPSVV